MQSRRLGTNFRPQKLPSHRDFQKAAWPRPPPQKTSLEIPAHWQVQLCWLRPLFLEDQNLPCKKQAKPPSPSYHRSLPSPFLPALFRQCEQKPQSLEPCKLMSG